MKLRRFDQNPIITRALDPSLGNNIDGPSLIRVPDWVPDPLGRYYLYFAHHQGSFIRLAYADDLRGPWKIHAPGVLNVQDSTCTDHVASPDVHVDHSRRRIRMYFHGVAFPSTGPTDGHEHRFGEAGRWIGTQRTKLALSRDGLSFQARDEVLGASYFRVFQWEHRTYALAMPGVFYRSRDGITGFEPGPILFPASFRHCAVHVSGSRLHVFFTRAGDCPESILHTAIDLRPDWQAWTPGPITTVMRPERDYEGAHLPWRASERGPVFEPVAQLRDPAIFVEDGRAYLLYAAAGEQAIGMARIDLPG
ncbi:hypothetical protein EGT29_28250 [Pigmentiphaga sp. H8]|uniref:hypothetical protein n=1 Tax=Pigmentiphaga sp. H8 TaxID=2488560 RepID=UPI000F5918E6|nr:hypothetical protein [Pigmentiphaga sp. H8]AZG11483.1 hypothetical protein EGT29_28250 [Pigmentiphaga sp. H8]